MGSWSKLIQQRFRVRPGARVRLSDYDPGWTGDGGLDKAERKQRAKALLAEDVEDLIAAQELLYAANTWAVLLIFQAMDAAGKDSVIKHVMSGVNPQGCRVYSFRRPSEEELDHTFLWRCMKALPERGRIGIFNRSYYEEVLVVRVHPELLAAQRLPEVAGGTEQAGGRGERVTLKRHRSAKAARDGLAGAIGEAFWQARYDDINAFERHLVRNGTLVLKFFLHVSRAEQRQRLLARLERPEKHWKFDPADLRERALWHAYTRAYEDAISATSTAAAPWYIVPADHKWVTRAVVARIVSEAIEGLGLAYPRVPPERRREIEEAKRLLAKEGTE